MGQAISYQLLQALRHGAENLSNEAHQQVCRYVMNQRDENEAFMNRGRQVDLYYTLFGWMLCYALGIKTDAIKRKAYLKQFEMDRLDDLHQTVLVLCKMIDRLLLLPNYTPEVLLRLLADDATLRAFFETYQRHGSGGGTNAWAARLTMLEETDKALIHRLLAVQHESGGFLSHIGGAMPDLLSTAVALFALNGKGVKPRYDVKPFIEAHWMDDGSFAATLLDEHGDVEYVFYGLLAMGCV